MNRTAPFPFTLMFQNGPRRQGFASPRKPGAPLTARPFRRCSREKGKGANAKTVLRLATASRWSASSCTQLFGVDKTS
jgi:hypothetical protein